MSTPATDTPAVVTPPPTPPPVAPGTPAAAPPVPAPSDGAPVEGADDVTITSTTDTQEQVQAALDHKTPDPAAKTPAAAPVVPKVEPPAAPPTPDPVATEAAKTLAGRKKTLQERIDEATWEKHEHRRQAEAAAADNARLRAENEALKAGKPVPGAAPAPVKPAEPPPKPKLADFQNDPAVVDPYEAWTEAVSDWKAERATEKLRAELTGKIETDRKADQDRTEGERAAFANQQAMQSFSQRAQAYRAAVGGEAYDKVVTQIKQEVADGTREEQVYPPRLQLHVTRSEMGPALIYHFAQHPEDFREIAAMHDTAPSLMLVALGRLEGKLEATLPKPAPAGGGTAPATPATPATRAVDALASSSIAAVPVSTAPPPPTLVGSAPSATTVPLEDMPYQDYKAMRNAAERRRR